MAYSIDKKTGEITLYDFGKGIASSPEKGIADLKSVNISSVSGEVSVSYARTKQSQTPITNTTIVGDTSTTVKQTTNTNIAPIAGTVITLSANTITGLSNTYYWIVSATFNSGGGYWVLELASSFVNYIAGTIVSGMGLAGTATITSTNMGQPIAYASSNIPSNPGFPDYAYFVLDNLGQLWWKPGTSTNPNPPFTGSNWTLAQNSPTDLKANAKGIFCFYGYVIIVDNAQFWYKNFSTLGTAWGDSWGSSVTPSNSSAGLPVATLVAQVNGTAYIGGGSYVDTLTEVFVKTFDPTDATTYTFTPKAVQLQLNDFVTSISQIGSSSGTQFLIGGSLNIIYPWDGKGDSSTGTTFGPLIYLPEYNTVQLLPVNNLVYIFTGSKGNIYVTNGSSVTSVISVPDYIANTMGVNQDPYFIWGGVMYLRGRVWFSVKAPNCGGVWSFVPTINYFVEQDVGASLRCDNQNSYGTYSGYATVLFSAQGFPNNQFITTNQDANGPQYYSGWDSGSSTYGIDFSATTPFLGGAIIESDLVPVGKILEKKSFEQVEYKLAAPLVTGESVQLYFRMNATDAWTSCGTVIQNTTISLTDGGTQPMSGYYRASFQNPQWLQVRAVLTSTNTSPSFCRLTEIYIR